MNNFFLIFFILLNWVRVDVFFDAIVFKHFFEFLIRQFFVQAVAKGVYNLHTAVIAARSRLGNNVQRNFVVCFDGALDILAQKISTIIIPGKFELSVDKGSVHASVDVTIVPFWFKILSQAKNISGVALFMTSPSDVGVDGFLVFFANE